MIAYQSLQTLMSKQNSCNHHICGSDYHTGVHVEKEFSPSKIVLYYHCWIFPFLIRSYHNH